MHERIKDMLLSTVETSRKYTRTDGSEQNANPRENYTAEPPLIWYHTSLTHDYSVLRHHVQDCDRLTLQTMFNLGYGRSSENGPRYRMNSEKHLTFNSFKRNLKTYLFSTAFRF